jgi:hypothetical protein
LASVVTQESNSGGEEKHQDEINWIRNFLIRTPPDDEDDLEDEEKDGELNLSPHELSEFESIIDPPCEKAGSHSKGRGDGSQDQEVKTNNLKRGILEQEMEKNEERGTHQKGDGKVDDHWVGMASGHRELLNEILKNGWEVS